MDMEKKKENTGHCKIYIPLTNMFCENIFLGAYNVFKRRIYAYQLKIKLLSVLLFLNIIIGS